LAQSITLHSGVTVLESGAITRISCVSESAAEAGARVSDGILRINCTNVLGLTAKQICELFVGTMGSIGMMSDFPHVCGADARAQWQ
jgi:hypothetical protein